MKQQDIGIDLGTSSIVIATETQGIVLSQPTAGAVDVRTGSVIAVGERALRMVGRAPAYIDIIRPLKDGVIHDHRMTNELIIRFVSEVCPSRLVKPRGYVRRVRKSHIKHAHGIYPVRRLDSLHG